jgi:hypothetical protein
MQEEGLLKKMDDGRYELTTKSKQEMGWSTGMRGGAPQSIEGMLNEINGYVSYFEDLSKTDNSRLASYGEQIRSVGERLLSLVGKGGASA